ncbi:pesticin C-terminus-like muramidase [Dyadobacter chenwenxiniae]|uniref:Pesticin C-terminus-like muramidase n=1 Tax=Dyadobacter chenwenxiniae TaxID=2906456 RepID=A0A9X1PFY9_9BACT|nr:pesticin C-terminus-like muramidase [Dyadobacter chenwenxiniae]MCF0060637.1 pesticin C-terminus-like muramidase [Dyadobacter chenwenxiniae]UON80469.1 pesticin C-terminus-like muramidase [Dyadobacter chenwenxiniae]
MAKYTFTYHQEIGHQGQSLVPHFPGGKSGVTIGPGYDMGHRTPQEIYTDLTNAGIDPETAYALIDAAEKTGPEAAGWVAERGGIFITEQQQRSLFENVLVPEYEQRTIDQIANFVSAHPDLFPENTDWESLSGRQKQILFDYVYNTGSLSRFPELTTAVLNEDWDTVSLHYERFSDDQPLVYRNEMFYREFLDPEYVHEDEEAENFNVQPVAEDQRLDQQIDELYSEDEIAENTDDVQTKDSDEWYEHI